MDSCLSSSAKVTGQSNVPNFAGRYLRFVIVRPLGQDALEGVDTKDYRSMMRALKITELGG